MYDIINQAITIQRKSLSLSLSLSLFLQLPPAFII